MESRDGGHRWEVKRMVTTWTRPVSTVAPLVILLCSTVLAQEGDSMLTRKIERQGEQFVVQVSKDQREATVTGQHDSVVTIRPNSGNFAVRLPNGWGGWRPTMDAAVEYAVSLYFEARRQLTADEALQEMIDYVADKSDTEENK